jgi:multiple sugar transport system permease protein
MFRRFFCHTSPFSPSPAWRVFSYTLLVFWAIVVLFPLYWLVITSFKLPIDVSQGPKYLPFVDFQPSLHAWEYILFDQGVTVTRPTLTRSSLAFGERWCR